MSHPVLDRVGPVMARLAASPLYRASNAAMELFHSNVLAWSFRSYPVESAALAELFGVAPAADYGVLREKRHIDLIVDDGARALVCENKVTAMPDRDQLNRYRAALLEHESSIAGRGVYRLLSLVEPVFDLPEPWTRVTYDEVAVAARAVSSVLAPGFDADFLAQYASLCADLDALVAACGLAGHENEPYNLDADADRQLHDAGIRDLVVKLRTVQLVLGVQEQVRDVPDDGWEAGFSRGLPLATYYTKPIEPADVGPVHLGWQLQGRQMRIVSLFLGPHHRGLGDALKARRAEWSAHHLSSWFDGDHIGAALPGLTRASSGKLSFNHYAPDFVYRYRLVDDNIRVHQLMSGLAALTRSAALSAASLR